MVKVGIGKKSAGIENGKEKFTFTLNIFKIVNHMKKYDDKIWALNENEVGWVQDSLNANCPKIDENEWRVTVEMLQFIKELAKNMLFLPDIMAQKPQVIKKSDLQEFVNAGDKLF